MKVLLLLITLLITACSQTVLRSHIDVEQSLIQDKTHMLSGKVILYVIHEWNLINEGMVSSITVNSESQKARFFTKTAGICKIVLDRGRYEVEVTNPFFKGLEQKVNLKLNVVSPKFIYIKPKSLLFSGEKTEYTATVLKDDKVIARRLQENKIFCLKGSEYISSKKLDGGIGYVN
ncbi:hypothetical protein [Pleionea mediterranea]|uniref:Carboxypeptidase regulatory-like domain-containing protein n=1 Tax=Pleionea mediterranea TaxID=523701 RepID=A0A316G3I1_9GAMM|nr:hypothetical protein [Pleionea mediterranea]PWK54340.1 hypothetical protein C8D97_101188 [Pleionea mediterranea]